MAETRHVANASSQWRAVCDEPDYCRVGKRIVAFQSHALLDPWQRASTDVKAQSLPVYRQGDLLRGMLADNGRHIVSGTSLGSGHVLILEGQQDVKVNGVPVARHDSACRVNCDASGAGGARGFLQVCTKDAAQADAEGHGSNSFARQALDAAQERYALHASGEAPLMPQQSLALRAEINRLSQIVNPGSHNLWGDYSAAEKAYLAQKAADQRRAMNNVGMSAGGLLAIGGWIARLFNAREEVVEGATEISAGLLGGHPLRPQRQIIRAGLPKRSLTVRRGSRGIHVVPKQYQALDWKAVVPKKGPYSGQTREDHVRLHNVDNLGKPAHGVFYGDGVDLTNKAFRRAQDLGIVPDAHGTLTVPMGEIVGRAGGAAGSSGQLFYTIEIKLVPGTNQIITAYPR